MSDMQNAAAFLIDTPRGSKRVVEGVVYEVVGVLPVLSIEKVDILYMLRTQDVGGVPVDRRLRVTTSASEQLIRLATEHWRSVGQAFIEVPKDHPEIQSQPIATHPDFEIRYGGTPAKPLNNAEFDPVTSAFRKFGEGDMMGVTHYLV